MATNPIICAIDTEDLAHAEALSRAVAPHVGMLKLGLQFFTAHGRAGVQRIADIGCPLFLDLKFHDIPNTVQHAIEALAGLPIALTTVHASGGPAMLRACATAANNVAQRTCSKPNVVAVTVLTSMDATDLDAVGQPADTMAQVVRLAKLTQACGLDGIVCSPHEIAAVRAACGENFQLVVPGIRPAEQAGTDDQKRTLTPAQALAAGATHLVIGRPITAAASPAEAAAQIAASLR